MGFPWRLQGALTSVHYSQYHAGSIRQAFAAPRGRRPLCRRRSQTWVPPPGCGHACVRDVRGSMRVGYVVARLIGLNGFRVCRERLPSRMQAPDAGSGRAICEIAIPACLRCHRELSADSRPRHVQGASDGQRLCEHCFGERDIRQHPRYRDAAARERFNARTSLQRFVEILAHELEYVTLRSYLVVHRADRMGYPEDLPGMPGTTQS